MTGKEMAEIRRSIGMTTAGMARALGRSPSGIKKMEVGTLPIAPEVATWLVGLKAYLEAHAPPPRVRRFAWSMKRTAPYHAETLEVPDEVANQAGLFTSRTFPAKRKDGSVVRVVIDAGLLKQGEVRLRSR